MSSAPPNGKATHTATPPADRATQARSGSVDKPRAGAAAKSVKTMTPEQRHQVKVISIALAVVALVALGIYGYFNWRTIPGPPRLNANVDTLARFTATHDFDQLPFDRQRLYMKNLGDKKKELEEEFKAGKITKGEYEDALSIVWLGKQFKKIDKYHTLGELDKKYYLDSLLDDEAAEEATEDPNRVKHDKEKVKALVQRFPTNERADFESFHKALKDRQKEREKQAKAAAKAARQANTRPTSRPADTTK
jgi:hypothetical protein